MTSTTVASALTTSLRATWNELRQAAAGDDFPALLAQVFGASAADAEQLRQRILSGSELGLCFEVLYPYEMNGSLGGYKPSGTPGAATMDVSAELLADSAHAGTLRRMLLEAIGHHIHMLLHGDVDTAGEEGHQFASLLQGDGCSAKQQADAESKRSLHAFAALVPRDPDLREQLRSCSQPDDILQLAHHKGFTICSTELREESSNLAAPHWPWSGKGLIHRRRFFAAA
ncbi:MAG: Nif11-like leader peptide family RiPP precursor [Prochlorococcaceae cyanobacterium]